MQIASTGNPTRAQLFQNLRGEQSEALLQGDFENADHFYAAEKDLADIKGADTADMFATAMDKRKFWSSDKGKFATAGILAAIAILPGAVIGGGLSVALNSTTNSLVGGAIGGVVAGSIATGFASIFGVGDYGAGPLKPVFELRNKKSQQFRHLAKVLKQQGAKTNADPFSRVTTDRKQLQSVLSRELAAAETEGDIPRVVELRKSLKFLSNAKGDDLVEIFRENKDRNAVGALVIQSHDGIKDSQFQSFNVTQAVSRQSEPALESYLNVATGKLQDLESQISAMTTEEKRQFPEEFQLLTEAKQEVQKKMTEAQDGVASILRMKRSEKRLATAAGALALTGAEHLIEDREKQVARDLSKQQAQVQVAQMG